KILVLKVSDFGQAQDLKESKKLLGVVGSLGFQSPEVLKRESLTSALDIFSIGAILFRMLLGVTYKAPGEIPDGKTKPVQAYAKMSADARDLLQRTLEYEPNNRIKMPDLLAHPFLINGPVPQSVSWDMLKKVAPLAAEDNAADTDGDCQGEISKSREEEAAETLEEEKLAREIAADRTMKQKGNKDVAVCGGKKVWDDDSDDEEEEVKGRKKVKVMQKGAVSENKAAEDKEGDHGGDQDAWPTHLFNL
ncbi:Phosphoenolpyruvate carboxylase kinase 1, partial [Linnemannia elongata]